MMGKAAEWRSLGTWENLVKDEAALHEGVGIHAATCGIDACVCVGDLAVHIAEAARKANPDFPVYYEKTKRIPSGASE